MSTTYDNWKYDGWHLYVLTNGEDIYVGISSNPVQRLSTHRAKQTLKGKLRFIKVRLIGKLWRALDLESALQRKAKIDAVEVMLDDFLFEELERTTPQVPIEDRKPYIQGIYKRYQDELAATAVQTAQFAV